MEEAVKYFLDRWLEAAYPDVSSGWETGLTVCIALSVAFVALLFIDTLVDRPWWVYRHYGEIIILLALSTTGVVVFGSMMEKDCRNIRFEMMTRNDDMRRRYEQLETYLRTERDFVETGHFQGAHEHFSESVGNPGK